MTLDDLEHQNKGFDAFFGDFGLRDTFQAQIVPKLKVSISRFKETCTREHQKAVPT